MRKHDAKQMRAAALSLFNHPTAQPEIYLQLLTCRTFHAPERQLLGTHPAQNKPAHSVITAAKLPFGYQILINPPDRQALLERRFDLLPPRLTQADRTWNAGRAGLRVRDRFWLFRQILCHRSTVQIQLPGDPPPRPSLLLHGYNALLLVHFELIHRPKMFQKQEHPGQCFTSEVAGFDPQIPGWLCPQTDTMTKLRIHITNGCSITDDRMLVQRLCLPERLESHPVQRQTDGREGHWSGGYGRNHCSLNSR